MLLLDIGNTRIKWGEAADGGPVQGEPAVHHGDPARAITNLPLPVGHAACVAQVFGRASEAAIELALREAGCTEVRFERTQKTRGGLTVAYDDPARLGVDRWLAMIALWSQWRTAFCVVHAGTALTFDAVDGRGRHLGGLIAPGLRTAAGAVRASTRFDFRDMTLRPDAGLGTSTEDCVRLGALHGAAGLVERALRHVDGPRVLCGGDADALAPLLPGDWDVRSGMVLAGLQVLAGEADA